MDTVAVVGDGACPYPLLHDGACTYPCLVYGACTYPLLGDVACTSPLLQTLVSCLYFLLRPGSSYDGSCYDYGLASNRILDNNNSNKKITEGISVVHLSTMTLMVSQATPLC
jgi:hypothetical protein